MIRTKIQQVRRGESGVALIELMVVILIIAILAGGVLVSFLGNDSKAQDASARTNLKNVAHSLQALKTENSGSTWASFPTSDDLGRKLALNESAYTFLTDGSASNGKDKIVIDKENNTMLKINAQSESGYYICMLVSARNNSATGRGATPTECFNSAKDKDGNAASIYNVCGQDLSDSTHAVGWALSRAIWEMESEFMWQTPKANPPHHALESGHNFWLGGKSYSGDAGLLDESGDDLGGYLTEYNGNCPNVAFVNGNKHQRSSRGLITSAAPLTSQTVTVSYYLWSGAPVSNPTYDKWNRATFVVNDSKGHYYCAEWRGDGASHYGKVGDTDAVNAASALDPASTRDSSAVLDSNGACNAQDFAIDDNGSGGHWPDSW